MNALSQDEDEQLNKWLKLQPDAIEQTNAAASGSNIQSPHPPTQLSPVSTSTGAADESNQTENDARIKNSHPGNADELNDPLTKYVQGQESQVDKYGPEQEAAVLKNIADTQNSLGNKVARGGATFADAIMQGVARAGNPGFAQQFADRENRAADLAKETIPTLQKMNAENMGEKQKLEGMTSSSPLGGAKAAAYQKVFKQLFPQMSPAELNAMTKDPAIAEKMFPEMGPIIDKQVQNELKKMQIDATVSHNQQEAELSDIKNRAEHPILDKFGMLPHVTGVGGSNGSNFNHQAIPPGTVYKAPDGTMRRKK